MISFPMWIALFLIAGSMLPTSTVGQRQDSRRRQQYSQWLPRPQPQRPETRPRPEYSQQPQRPQPHQFEPPPQYSQQPPRPQPQFGGQLSELIALEIDLLEEIERLSGNGGGGIILPDTRGCPDGPGGGYHENNGNCFYFSLEGGSGSLKWLAARTACNELGRSFGRIADLAEMGGDTKVSDERLMDIITEQRTSVWLGANNPIKPAKGIYTGWVWSRTGRELSKSFPFWGSNEPNNAGYHEWCVETYPYGEGSPRRMYLNDVSCQKVRPYVCQFF